MSRTDPKRQQELRAKILQAAAALIASEGYHGMTMRNLARAAGTSLANVYNYFAAKEDILFALQREAFETLIAAAGEALEGVGDAAGRLYGFIYHHVRYCADHPEVMHVLVHEAASLPPEERRIVRATKERYFEIGRDIVRRLIAEADGSVRPGGDVRPSVGPDDAELERLTYSLFGMLNWIYGWYRPAVHGDTRELARTIHGIALGGLAARGAGAPVRDRMEARVAAAETPPLLGSLRPLAGGVS